MDGWLESVSVLGAAAPPLFLLLLLLLFLRPPSQLVRFVSVVLAVQAETSILRARKAFEAMDEHNKRLAAAAAAAERREALLVPILLAPKKRYRSRREDSDQMIDQEKSSQSRLVTLPYKKAKENTHRKPTH